MHFGKKKKKKSRGLIPFKNTIWHGKEGLFSDSNRETKALVDASKTVKEAKNFIIITWEEEKELIVDGVKIQVIPVWKWLIRN